MPAGGFHIVGSTAFPRFVTRERQSMSEIKLPTLRQITGERPRCQYCDKELRPWTSAFTLYVAVALPPTLDEIDQAPPSKSIGTLSVLKENFKWGYRPERVFRIKHRETPYDVRHKWDTRFTYWTGRYDGYVRADTHVLFCSLTHAAYFGKSGVESRLPHYVGDLMPLYTVRWSEKFWVDFEQEIEAEDPEDAVEIARSAGDPDDYEVVWESAKEFSVRDVKDEDDNDVTPLPQKEPECPRS
jgi:hypothetical protein